MKPSVADSFGRDTIATSLTILFLVMICGYVAVNIVSSLAVPVGKFDESIPLVDGMLILRGYTPNLDFYSFYPPLNFYLNAALFRLLGRTIIAVRIFGAITFVGVLALAMSFYRSLRVSGPIAAAAVLLIATSIGAAVNLAAWPGFAISLAMLLLYVCGQNSERFRFWLLAGSGLLGAAALLSRVNFGGYAVVAISLDLVQRFWFRDSDRFSVRDELKAASAIVLPLIAGVVGFCLWVYGGKVGAGLSEFIVSAQKLMALRGFFPLQYKADLASALGLPFFWFFFRMVYGTDRIRARSFVPLILCAALLMVAHAGREHLTIAMTVVAMELLAVFLMHLFLFRLYSEELTILLFFCCLLHYYFSRADWFHWRLLPIAASFLIPFAFPRHDSSQHRHAYVTTSPTALAVITAAAFVFVSAFEFRPDLSGVRAGWEVAASFVRDYGATDTDRMLGNTNSPPAWSSVYPDGSELQALRYMRERTDESTPLFVGVKEHAKVYNTDLRMYWLADRPLGARTFQLETRIATEAPVQEGIIDDLERDKRTWIILDCEMGGDPEYSRLNYQGSHLLDNYIEENFGAEATFGRYVVLSRASAAGTAAAGPPFCRKPATSPGLQVSE